MGNSVTRCGLPTLAYQARVSGLALAVAALITVGGCTGIPAQESLNAQHYINQALAGLSLGDYPYAEQAVTQALARGPANPVALLIAGGVYQRTGRLQQAANAYRAAASVPGHRSVVGDLWGVEGMTPVRTVASHALRQLNGGEPVSVTTMRPSPQLTEGADYNQADRFAILRKLWRNNLITPEEFEEREAVKLPSSVTRPVPTYEEVADLLAQLSAAYATRNLSAEKHVRERTRILDALVPRRSNPKAAPIPSPSAEPAEKKGGETHKEENEAPSPEPPKVASGDGVVPNPVATLHSGRGPVRVIPYNPQDEDVPAALSHANVAVHLASFRSRAAALRGWEKLKKRFPELAGLQPQISTLTVPDQGTFFRLNAGPIPTVEDAETLCNRLKKQFCEAVFVGG